MLNEEEIIKLKEIFINTLDLNSNEDIENITKLSCIKWDSLAQAILIAAVADEFKIDITGKEFEMFNSYKSIKYFLENKIN